MSRFAGRALAFAAGGALAQLAAAQSSALPVAPEKLAAVLPVAWSGMTREQPETESSTTPLKRSAAQVTISGKRGASEPFRALFVILDEGASMANMYAYGASYLNQDVKGDTEHSAVLSGGRRVLVTSFTKDSMSVESQVAKRFIVRTGCTRSTEAQCLEAFSRWDFKAIEALKP